MPSPVLLSAPCRQLCGPLPCGSLSTGSLVGTCWLYRCFSPNPPTIPFGKISPGSRAKSRLCKHPVPSAALPTQRKVESESEKSLGSCD